MATEGRLEGRTVKEESGMVAEGRVEGWPVKEEAVKTEAVERCDTHPSSCGASLTTQEAMCDPNNQKNVEQVKDSLDWLPAGWILEMRTRKSGVFAGHSYKVYYDPCTGLKFYSKAQVCRYLQATKFSSPRAAPKRSIITRGSSNTCSSTNQKEPKRKRSVIANITKNVSASTDPMKSIIANNTNNVRNQVNYAPDGLPNGWIKETRYRNSKSTEGSKIDQYYTDPVNGYVFRSLKDVFRYIETGEVSKYAFKPKNGSTSNMHASGKDSHFPTAVKNGQLKRNKVKRRLFSDKKPDSNVKTERGISELPESSLMPLKHPSSQCAEAGAESCCTTLSNIDYLKEGNSENAQINTGIYPPCPGVILSVQPLACRRDDIIEPAITRQSEPERRMPSEMPTEPSQMKQLDREIEYLSQLPEKQYTLVDLAEVGLDSTKPLQPEGGLQASKGELLEETQSELKDENQFKPKKFERGRRHGLRKLKDVRTITIPLQASSSPGSRKSKKARTITMPRRASKRLAGLSADPIASPKIAIEWSRRGALKLSNQLQSNPAPVLNTPVEPPMDAAGFLLSEETSAADVELPDILESKEHVGDLATSGKLVESGTSGKQVPDILESKEHVGDLAISGKHVESGTSGKQLEPGKVSDDKSSSSLTIPFGDSWPDPCIEFAFKTLTGDIPVLEDTVTFQRFFNQQPRSNQSPSANGSAPLNFGSSKGFS